MKGIMLFVLFFISVAFSYNYINGDDFYLKNVTCHAELTILDGYNTKSIHIKCDNNYEFEAEEYLAESNRCNASKIAGRDTIDYGYYKDSFYEFIIDEYGITISEKQVNLDCVDIYKKFKSKIVGKIRTGTIKCNDDYSDCYTYYDDGTKIKR